MAIIAKADYKTIKGISASTYDAQLDALIPMLQAKVEKWAGRVFDSATYTDQKYDGQGATSLQLKNYPVTVLTSVQYVDADGNETTIDSTAYTLDAATGIIKFQPSGSGRIISNDNWDDVQVPSNFADYPQFFEGHQNIQVTYTAGYTSQTMPSDLKFDMIQYVDFVMSSVLGGVGVGQFKSEKLGDYSYDRGAMDGVTNDAVLARFFSAWRTGRP